VAGENNGLLLNLGAQLAQEPSLPDSGFSCDHHQPGASGTGFLKASQDVFQLFPAAHELCRDTTDPPAGLHCLHPGSSTERVLIEVRAFYIRRERKYILEI
jgi:hypothetical protein